MTDIYLFHAWHNQGLCILTPEEFESRIAEIRRDKPADELDLRLHYLMAHISPTSRAQAELDKAQAEVAKARAEVDEAQAEWEKSAELAQAEWEKSWAKWEKSWAKWAKARAKLDKTLAEWNKKWHKKLCHPKCAWTPENCNIFAKGKSLERLLR